MCFRRSEASFKLQNFVGTDESKQNFSRHKTSSASLGNPLLSLHTKRIRRVYSGYEPSEVASREREYLLIECLPEVLIEAELCHTVTRSDYVH